MVRRTKYYGAIVQTPEGTGSNTSGIKKMDAFQDSTYIYGLKVYYNDNTSVMFGNTNGLSPTTRNFTGAIYKIEVHEVSGVLRGERFYEPAFSPFIIGYLNNSQIVFNDPDNELVDIKTSSKQIGSVTVICAMKFYYTGPLLERIVDRFALSAVGILAQSFVLAKSYMEVGKLRHDLAIKAPSCDPPPGTDPAKAQLWYRTFRAQENTKEAFLFFIPTVMIASVFGYRAFGKWAPQAVGVLALTGAVFRHQYLKAYIEDADKRGKPFAYNLMFSVRPVAFLAVASCGYLVGKQLVTYVRDKTKKAKPIEVEE